MMTPYLSNVRKSLVKASETPGPPREKHVYVTTYWSSSGTKVMRGSSIPHISSGYSLGLGIKLGWLSISQPSTPFRERAGHNCYRPRRFSTRESDRVDPPTSR